MSKETYRQRGEANRKEQNDQPHTARHQLNYRRPLCVLDLCVCVCVCVCVDGCGGDGGNVGGGNGHCNGHNSSALN